MAQVAKKPAKHTKKEQDPRARKLIGKKVLYIGKLICPVCGNQSQKRMASEYKGIYYCSENCILRLEGN